MNAKLEKKLQALERMIAHRGHRVFFQNLDAPDVYREIDGAHDVSRAYIQQQTGDGWVTITVEYEGN